MRMPLSDDTLQMLRDRFDALDKRLDAQDEVMRRVEIQVRATNGRVTDLEKINIADDAVSNDRTQRRVRRTDQYRVVIGGAIAVGSAILGGVAGAVGHAVGWW